MKAKLTREIFFEVLVFIVSLLTIVLLKDYNIALMVVLILLCLAANQIWKKKNDWIFYLAGLIIGTLAEIVCVSYGVWSYGNPTIWGLPIWLPFAWGFATVLIVRVAETFVTISKR